MGFRDLHFRFNSCQEKLTLEEKLKFVFYKREKFKYELKHLLFLKRQRLFKRNNENNPDVRNRLLRRIRRVEFIISDLTVIIDDLVKKITEEKNHSSL